MRYGAIAITAVLVAGAAWGQAEEISCASLERMGLGGMKQITVVTVASPRTSTYADRPHQPVLYGQRQHNAYLQQRQNLKRTMWRIAHRSFRF